jgi:hypothetical protein
LYPQGLCFFVERILFRLDRVRIVVILLRRAPAAQVLVVLGFRFALVIVLSFGLLFEVVFVLVFVVIVVEDFFVRRLQQFVLQMSALECCRWVPRRLTFLPPFPHLLRGRPIIQQYLIAIDVELILRIGNILIRAYREF